MRYKFLTVTIALLPFAPTLAQSNINATGKHAWGENIGWTNWRDAGEPVASQGVQVHSTHLSGFVWGENIGWINLGDAEPVDAVAYANLDASDFGVNLSVDGVLWGLAWAENIGWLNFGASGVADPAEAAFVGCDGVLHGSVWSENVGWIVLDHADEAQRVALDDSARPHTCDMNHDGLSNGADIQVFVDLVLFGEADWRDLCSGDLASPADGFLGTDDATAFLDCLLGS